MSLFKTAVALTTLLTYTSAKIQFNPPKLQIKDAKLYDEFKVVLDAKPTANTTTVFCSGEGIIFDKCSLTFTNNDWNVEQTIKVTGVPAFDSISDPVANINCRPFDGDKKGEDATLPVTREITPGGRCYSWGDPHIQQFGSTSNYDVNTGGLHYLYDSEHLTIQVNHALFTAKKDNDAGTEVKINDLVAIRYGNSVYILDTSSYTNSKTGEMQTTKNGNDGVVYTAPNGNKDHHNLLLPDGTIIKLTLLTSAGVKYINVELLLSAGYTTIGGLCNKPGNDLFLKDKTTLPKTPANSAAFGKSWQVPDADALPKGNIRASKPALTKAASSCSLPTTFTPVVPPVPPPVCPPYVPIVKPLPIAISPPTPEYLAGCEKHCTKLFVDVDCLGLLDKDVFIKVCIADTRIGLIQFAKNALETYHRRCSTLTNIKLALEKAADKIKPIVALQKKCGYNDNKCLKDCSGKGACFSYGCKCNVGYSGEDCATADATLVTLNPVTQNYSTGVAPSKNETAVTLLPEVKPPVAPVYAPISTLGYTEPKLPVSESLPAGTPPKTETKPPTNDTTPTYDAAPTNELPVTGSLPDSAPLPVKSNYLPTGPVYSSAQSAFTGLATVLVFAAAFI